MQYTYEVITGLTIGLAIHQSLVMTRQKQLKHIVLLGKYWKTATPGISLKLPFVSWVDKESETNIKEQVVELRLKTKDQVTFGLSLKVFYKVVENVDMAYKSSYNLEDYDRQLISIATDSAIPVANNISLEEVFNRKEDVLEAAKNALTAYFANYGIEIEKVLSDEPQLPSAVEESANEVIAAKRLNDAAEYRAEAIKTEKVGEATADGESVRIRMEEVGKARQEYAKTTSEAVNILKSTGVDVNNALDFLTRVGDQDAIVTASRNSETAILSVGGGNQPCRASEIAPIVKALTQTNDGAC